MKLHVSALTDQGKIYHTYKDAANGKWQSFFGDVFGVKNFGIFNSISSMQNGGDLQINIVKSDGKFYSIYRNKNGNWDFRNIEMYNNGLINPNTSMSLKFVATNDNISFRMIKTNTRNGLINTRHSFDRSSGIKADVFPDLKDFDVSSYTNQSVIHTSNSGNTYTYVVGVSLNGEIVVGKSEDNGSTFTVDNAVLKLNDNRHFVKVACAFINKKLHILGVTNTGNLLHTIYKEQSSFGDVETQSGEVGQFCSVNCSVHNNHLNVVAVTTNGEVKHTFRMPNGSWKGQWDDVETKSGGKDIGKIIDASIAKIAFEY